MAGDATRKMTSNRRLPAVSQATCSSVVGATLASVGTAAPSPPCAPRIRGSSASRSRGQPAWARHRACSMALPAGADRMDQYSSMFRSRAAIRADVNRRSCLGARAAGSAGSAGAGSGAALALLGRTSFPLMQLKMALSAGDAAGCTAKRAAWGASSSQKGVRAVPTCARSRPALGACRASQRVSTTWLPKIPVTTSSAWPGSARVKVSSSSAVAASRRRCSTRLHTGSRASATCWPTASPRAPETSSLRSSRAGLASAL